MYLPHLLTRRNICQLSQILLFKTPEAIDVGRSKALQ